MNTDVSGNSARDTYPFKLSGLSRRSNHPRRLPSNPSLTAESFGNCKPGESNNTEVCPKDTPRKKINPKRTTNRFIFITLESYSKFSYNEFSIFILFLYNKYSKMDKIYERSNILVQDQSLAFTRSLSHHIDWTDRLIGILGSRGTGKTTLLLQQLKQTFGPGSQGVYLSLDDIYFTDNRLIDFAENFRQQGGKLLLLDEVHRYPGWAREIKNIYDFYKDLRIIFTGSSVMDMLRQNADLSRRAVQYELTGLSFRECLELSGIGRFPALSLKAIFANHTTIASNLVAQFKPLQYFQEYLSIGVEWVWLVDPDEKSALIYSRESPAGAVCDVLRTENPHIEISLADAFNLDA